MSLKPLPLKLCACLLLGGALGLPAWAQPAPKQPPSIESSDLANPAPEYNMVTLQGLNKVTGHMSKLSGAVGTLMRFGNIEIVPHKCWKSNPEDQPENAALLDISELTPGEEPRRIFLGWMFSSSPGLSGLEHPVYDINVLSCESSDDPEEEEPKKPAKPAKK